MSLYLGGIGHFKSIEGLLDLWCRGVYKYGVDIIYYYLRIYPLKSNTALNF